MGDVVVVVVLVSEVVVASASESVAKLGVESLLVSLMHLAVV